MTDPHHRGRHAAPDEADDDGVHVAAPVQQQAHQPSRPGPGDRVPEPAAVRPLGSPVRTDQAALERCADIALAALPRVLRVLDVGCGDGSLLRELVLRVPYAETCCGIDSDPGQVAAATAARDPRLDYRLAAAEALPFDDDTFDLVTSVRSLHLWHDQAGGLAELARVTRRSGRVVVIDRLRDGPAGERRIRSARALRAAAQATGLRVDNVQTVTRRLIALPGLRAYVLAR